MKHPVLSILIPAAGAGRRLGQVKQLVKYRGKSLLQNAVGASIISPQSTGLMIFLCDQWRIKARDLQTLAATWRSGPPRIVVAQAQGHYIPPVIFPASCFDQLRQLEGTRGARDVLQTHPELLTAVPLENAAFDLDTQTHLDELESYKNQYNADHKIRWNSDRVGIIVWATAYRLMPYAWMH